MADAAERFAAMGAYLVAAEAALAAAEAFRRDGGQRAAAAIAGKGERWLDSCEGASTPALAAPSATVPLTKREREVALLASDGFSSKDIADRLFLSVRTVDNHLQNVYTKLGVSNRAALGNALN